MLLKKVEENDLIKGYYESSNILMSEYDKRKQTLTVVFSNGGKYTYDNVSFTDFTRFEVADSQGKTLNAYIKPKYSYTLIERIDTKDVLVEIENIKQSTLNDYRGTIISMMKGMVEDWDKESQKFDDAKLDKIHNFTNTYKIKLNE